MDVSFYAVLEVPQSASFEEIRANYKEKCLKCHPDKIGPETQETGTFHKLQKAYETLRDPVKREIYDQSLLGKLYISCQSNNLLGISYQAERTISLEVDLDDMEHDEEKQEWSYACRYDVTWRHELTGRCGSHFLVSLHSLEQEIDVVQCLGCSLYIRVLFSECVDDA